MPPAHPPDTAIVSEFAGETGEPNYFFVGSRAYGRAPTFLLQTGLGQIDAIVGAIRPT